ncbi:hypothetical protein P8452_41598 [Trifolium repens]|nr:hypothetical protein P8452_41598 [Trifolium repens]
MFRSQNYRILAVLRNVGIGSCRGNLGETKHTEIWRIATLMEDFKSEIENWDLGAGIYISFYLMRNKLQGDANAMTELDSLQNKNAAYNLLMQEWHIQKWQVKYVICCYLLLPRVPHVMSSLVALTLLSVLLFLKTYAPVTCRMQCICLPAFYQRFQL